MKPSKQTLRRWGVLSMLLLIALLAACQQQTPTPEVAASDAAAPNSAAPNVVAPVASQAQGGQPPDAVAVYGLPDLGGAQRSCCDS